MMKHYSINLGAGSAEHKDSRVQSSKHEHLALVGLPDLHHPPSNAKQPQAEEAREAWTKTKQEQNADSNEAEQS